MKVLFIGGTGRNGSTLLGNLLGELPGSIHIGELRYLWDRGILKNWYCGCGSKFADCLFWQEVVKKTGLTESQARNLALQRDSFPSRTLLFPEAHRRASVAKMKKYIAALRSVYTTIFEITKCKIVVDSSKFPSHAYFLTQMEDFEVYIIHLVRDPRAVAYSWWKRSKTMGLKKKSEQMSRINPIISSLVWLEWNYIYQHIWGSSPRYLFLRYEDFVAKPLETVDKIVQWANISNTERDRMFIDENTVRLSRHHTVSGNPVRLTAGDIKIIPSSYTLNTAWKILVTTITFPLLVKYRYSIC